MLFNHTLFILDKEWVNIHQNNLAVITNHVGGIRHNSNSCKLCEIAKKSMLDFDWRHTHTICIDTESWSQAAKMDNNEPVMEILMTLNKVL